jgi:hypothetical protein
MNRLIIAYNGSSYPAPGGLIRSNVERICGALSDSMERIIFYRFVWDFDWEAGRCLANDIADGYTFVRLNYKPGDQLFIFGSSRGAFAARVLANLIARLGVLIKRDDAHEKAMKAYKDGKLDAFKVEKIKPNESSDLSETEKDFVPRAYEVEIEVVGCWDTVSRLDSSRWWPLTDSGGISGKYKHFDASLVKGEIVFFSFEQDLMMFCQESSMLSML